METKPIFEAPPARGLVPSEPSCVVSPALVVDLDGTLLKTDLLLESLLVLVKHKPLCIFLLPIRLLKGKAYLKRQIALRVELDVNVLPYRAELLNYLDMQRRAGRYIVLATASDSRLARQVADHLKIFDLVFASDGSTNLAGNAKRDRLVSAFGAQRFDYAGNGRRDLPVWQSARKAILVNGNPRLRDRLARSAQVDWLFEQPKRGLLDLVRPLRFRHWLKNVCCLCRCWPPDVCLKPNFWRRRSWRLSRSDVVRLRATSSTICSILPLTAIIPKSGCGLLPQATCRSLTALRWFRS